MKLRPAEPSDRDGIIALIDSIFREYGDRIFLEDADADLLDIASNYGRGLFQVLEEQGRVRGTVALVPAADSPGICHLRRMYLDLELRGGGWGGRMMDWARRQALAMGMKRMECWTDTRFARAHAFYEKLGFQHDGRARDMEDGSMPYREYFYSLVL